MIQLLLDRPLLLLFVVAAIGYPLGRIKIGGSSLGVTAVLFVSNLRVAGHRLRELYLPQAFGAVVTRLRRDDIEFVPHGDTVLELGDRVRVVALILGAVGRIGAIGSSVIRQPKRKLGMKEIFKI